MAQLPTLNSERLVVRPFSEKHLTENYVGWLNDPEVVLYSEQRHRQHTLEECRQYFSSFTSSPHFFCAIEAKPSDTHVGNISVTVDTHNKLADIAIMVGDRDHWGKGLGCEAFILVMNELFENQSIRKVTAGTLAINQPMIKIMHAAGMTIECTRKRHFLHDGKEVDMVYAGKWSDS